MRLVMFMHEQLPYHEQLFQLINKMRTAHWDYVHGIKSAKEKEHRIGLEIDKLLREENARRNKKQIALPWK